MYSYLLHHSHPLHQFWVIGDEKNQQMQQQHIDSCMQEMASRQQTQQYGANL